jgi:hypothetical protein
MAARKWSIQNYNAFIRKSGLGRDEGRKLYSVYREVLGRSVRAVDIVRLPELRARHIATSITSVAPVPADSKRARKGPAAAGKGPAAPAGAGPAAPGPREINSLSEYLDLRVQHKVGGGGGGGGGDDDDDDYVPGDFGFSGGGGVGGGDDYDDFGYWDGWESVDYDGSGETEY